MRITDTHPDALPSPIADVPPSPVMRRWLSQDDAAAYLGVSARSLRNYTRTGAVKGRRLKGSRLIRYDRFELDKALRPVPSGGAA